MSGHLEHVLAYVSITNPETGEVVDVDLPPEAFRALEAIDAQTRSLLVYRDRLRWLATHPGEIGYVDCEDGNGYLVMKQPGDVVLSRHPDLYTAIDVARGK